MSASGTKCSHCEQIRLSRCSYADCPWEIDSANGTIAILISQLAETRAERDELKSAFDARVQEMSERFRAVNVAEALKQLGPDHLAMAERLQAAEAERDRLAADNARLEAENTTLRMHAEARTALAGKE